jgi:hypothetical protein
LSRKITCFETGKRKDIKKIWDSYEDGCFKGVQVIKDESDVKKLVAFRGQFFQALYDNLCQRFACTELLAASRVLGQQSLPDDILQKTLYGESDTAYLCKSFAFDSELSAEIVLGYAMFKRKGTMGAKLNHFT